MKERSQEVQDMVELSQECNTIIQKESVPEKLGELVDISLFSLILSMI